ncbi:acyl-CoA dehydrogenase family protein [Mycobacterium sp. M1]|uniref:Acyl-CoA dehydrogenase family protein n=1 Tax=Mycolicibacter acidiphilus TaxID=2835306 RepID=A0ABS5RHS3_9MYCO|nr:acyl-CoA dehydrogenase family protein [Mycolicibacter acidiphilus]MBS9533816.1 acyl-CoA dehydrogenase family protein [Mycolicibacter acidiphilus]
MDFAMSATTADYHRRLSTFLIEHVLPAETEYDRFRAAAGPDDHTVPPVLEHLKTAARADGLWNLFFTPASGLSNLDYAPLAELTGWSVELAPEATNCSAPDSGIIEILHLFGTAEQQERWLNPLLDGTIRAAFAMTEPAVASSDARNIATAIARDGTDYVLNGRKWWISGAADPRCRLLVVMGRTDPEAAQHRQHSLVLVPLDTPGVTVLRSLPVFGWQHQQGHCEITFDDVRVPVSNRLGEEGAGFAMMQAWADPGRLHHGMRCVGVAERALALLVDRARSRTAFGGPLAEQGVVAQSIAQSRTEIDQARLLCEKAAWTVDQHGGKAARSLVAQVKAVTPKMACTVIDRAIQVHGAAGIGDDTPLAKLYGLHRAMRIFDGPDEVHERTVARVEIDTAPSPLAVAATRH